MVCEYIYAKASPRHIMSQSGRKVSERSTKPPGFTIPCYFYMYNISSDDFAVIQTIRAEIYLFTMGTPYKINSRTLVLASSGEGFYHSNLPPPRRSELEGPDFRFHLVSEVDSPPPCINSGASGSIRTDGVNVFQKNNAATWKLIE